MVICPKCGERKIIENETEKKGVNKCMVLKSEPCELGMKSSGYPFRTCNAPCRIGGKERKKPLGLCSVGLTTHKMRNFKSATAAKVQRGRYFNRLRVS